MKTYHKINTVFKRDMEGNKKIILGAWALPEYDYLQNNEWVYTEKVDGTNIRVNWDGKDVAYGGRTEEAQIPNGIINRLNNLFYSEEAKKRLSAVFPGGNVVLFGEGYGAGIQKAGKQYNLSQDFVLFDILVGGVYLERHNVEDVAQKLGLEVVPVIGSGTLNGAIERVQQGFVSQWGEFAAEGIVARPKTEMLNRKGERIIAKIKTVDFK